jgi:hypothetical protein
VLVGEPWCPYCRLASEAFRLASLLGASALDDDDPRAYLARTQLCEVDMSAHPSLAAELLPDVPISALPIPFTAFFYAGRRLRLTSGGRLHKMGNGQASSTQHGLLVGCPLICDALDLVCERLCTLGEAGRSEIAL